jgi:hypothetical protein
MSQFKVARRGKWMENSFVLGLLSGLSAPLLFWPGAPASDLEMRRSAASVDNAWRRVGAHMRGAVAQETRRHG